MMRGCDRPGRPGRREGYSDPDAVGWRANRTASASTFDSNLSAMMDASQRAGCRVLQSLVAQLVPQGPPAIDCATFYGTVDAKVSDFGRALASIMNALGGVPPDATSKGSAALADATSQLVKRAVGPLCGEDSKVSPAALRARLQQVSLAYCASAPEFEAALPAGLLHRPVVLRAALDASTSRFLAATPAGRVVAADPMDATALMRWVVRPVSDGAAEYTLELDTPTATGRFLAAGGACADDGLSLAPSDVPEEGLQRWKVVRLRDKGAGAYALRAAHRGSCGADLRLIDSSAGARPVLSSGTSQVWLLQLSGSTRRANEGVPFNYVRPLTRDANASLVFAQPGGALPAPTPAPLAARTVLGTTASRPPDASSRPPVASSTDALEEDVFLPLGAPVPREAVRAPVRAPVRRTWTAWALAALALAALALAWWWRRRSAGGDANLLQQLNAEIAGGGYSVTP